MFACREPPSTSPEQVLLPHSLATTGTTTLPSTTLTLPRTPPSPSFHIQLFRKSCHIDFRHISQVRLLLLSPLPLLHPETPNISSLDPAPASSLVFLPPGRPQPAPFPQVATRGRCEKLHGSVLLSCFWQSKGQTTAVGKCPTPPSPAGPSLLNGAPQFHQEMRGSFLPL